MFRNQKLNQTKQCKQVTSNQVTPESSDRTNLLSWVVLWLVAGSFFLGCIDKDARTTFSDLAKVGVGGYIALMVPIQSKQNGQNRESNQNDSLN